jgi:hypothetical protein
LEGLFELPDGQVNMDEGEKNFRGYSFAVPDDVEVGALRQVLGAGALETA